MKIPAPAPSARYPAAPTLHIAEVGGISSAQRVLHLGADGSRESGRDESQCCDLKEPGVWMERDGPYPCRRGESPGHPADGFLSVRIGLQAGEKFGKAAPQISEGSESLGGRGD